MQMKQPWKYWNLKKVKEDRTATYGFIKQEEAKKSKWFSISLKMTENMKERATS